MLFKLLLIFSFIRLAYFLDITNLTKNECESVHRWSKRETNKVGDQTSRVIKLALVIDYKLKDMGGNTEHCEKTVNELNSLFRQFNVSVTLVKTIFLSQDDNSNLINKSITITYNNFQKYVEQLNRTNIHHFQLMSSEFTDENIRLIPDKKTNDMCGLSVGVNKDRVYKQTDVARSIARVLAHSLGIDTDRDTNCSNCDSCIMGKLRHNGYEQWSLCSINALKEILTDKTKFTCLNNPLFDGPRGRNGILEKEENCDCGLKGVNPCCNTTTCQFNINNICSSQKCDNVKPNCTNGVEPKCSHVEEYPVCDSSGQCICLNNETSSNCSCPDSHPPALSDFTQWKTYFYILLAVLLIWLIVAISFSCIICYMKRLRPSNESQPEEEYNLYAEVAYTIDDASYVSTSITGMRFRRPELTLPLLSPLPESGSESYDRPHSAYSGSHIYTEPIDTD